MTEKTTTTETAPLPDIDFSFLDNVVEDSPQTSTQLPEFNELLGGMLNDPGVTVQVNNTENATKEDPDFFDEFQIFSDEEEDDDKEGSVDDAQDCPLVLTYRQLDIIPGEDLANLDADVFKRSIDPSSKTITIQQILLIKDKRRVFKNRFSAKRSAAKQKHQLQKLKKQNKILKKKISHLQKSYDLSDTSKSRYIEHVEQAIEYRSSF